ncbi:hypothetical protein SAMN05444007_101499 [Cribrihabitans marinus]|uniref:DUF1127 domain-containing protein n=1 Tax=Cribrihabitans marinus TaxID=1227549 RepID=A0A1H6RE98_9RHOB|nr:hypothetical protein SAMN05444007_101499 [Cribrihabitans marinus]
MKGNPMIVTVLRIFARHRRCTPRGVPHGLPPHVMRDIGLKPSPERRRFPFHPLW